MTILSLLTVASTMCSTFRNWPDWTYDYKTTHDMFHIWFLNESAKSWIKSQSHKHPYHVIMNIYLHYVFDIFGHFDIHFFQGFGYHLQTFSHSHPYDVYNIFRDHFVYAPSQWETMLLCNIGFHWLGAYAKWSLILHQIYTCFCCALSCFGCIMSSSLIHVIYLPIFIRVASLWRSNSKGYTCIGQMCHHWLK